MLCRMIVRERAFGPLEWSGLRPSERSDLRSFAKRDDNKKYIFWIISGYPTKNGGKIWILRDRQKGFSERPKKVHFWKNQFQNLFQKSKNSNFAAIFVYIEFMNEFGVVTKRYYEM